MRKLLKGLGVVAVMVIMSVAAVYSSNSYFTNIEASDTAISSDLTSTILSYLDDVDYDSQVRNENAQNNSDVLISGSTGSNGSSSNDAVVPEFESGLAAYTYALNKYTNAKSIIVETTGVADTAIGAQEVKAIRQRNAVGHLYFTAISYSSFVQVAREVYYNGRIFMQRSSSTVSSSLAPTYDGNWTQSTSYISAIKTYKQKYGVGPDELNYIVSSETVLSDTFDASAWATALAAGTNYTFTMKLNPNGAGEKYKYNVKENAGAKELPSFTKVQIEVTINSKGNFVQLVSEDAYSLTVKGVSSDISTRVTDVFKRIDNGTFDVNVPSGL